MSVRRRCAPAADNAALWQQLAADDLSTVGTDHCPFFFEGQKDLGLAGGTFPPFNRIPGGMPGVESRLALLHTFGVGQGRLSLERWVEVCCTAPARIFGLAGRKGALTVGADADVVIFDPEREVTLSRADPARALRLHALRRLPAPGLSCAYHAPGPCDRQGWRVRGRLRRWAVPQAG